MVWFQCEDCGENLKKPKLPNHFRICSANKLSCIDCGEMFTQQSVQGHTQCITEAEKYGPKGQGKVSNATPAKPKPESKTNSDIDINVGLSSRPPWFCSLCNTNTTSKQTLLLHAEGKKHRAKARAFHASKKQLTSQTEESTPNGVGHTNGISSGKNSEEGSLKKVDELNESDPSKTTVVSSPVREKQNHLKKKRKLNESESVVSNGEVIQAERSETESKSLPKEQKISNATVGDDQAEQKVKWKKLISSILKSSPDGVLKIKKLQKLVLKSLQETGLTPDEDQLQGTLMHKIESSSRFMLDKKLVRLAPKGGS